MRETIANFLKGMAGLSLILVWIGLSMLPIYIVIHFVTKYW